MNSFASLVASLAFCSMLALRADMQSAPGTSWNAKGACGTNVRIPYARLTPRQHIDDDSEKVWKHGFEQERACKSNLHGLMAGELAWLRHGDRCRKRKRQRLLGQNQMTPLGSTEFVSEDMWWDINGSFANIEQQIKSKPRNDILERSITSNFEGGLRDALDELVDAIPWRPDGIVIGRDDHGSIAGVTIDGIGLISEGVKLFNIALQGPSTCAPWCDLEGREPVYSNATDYLYVFVVLVVKGNEVQKVKLVRMTTTDLQIEYQQTREFLKKHTGAIPLHELEKAIKLHRRVDKDSTSKTFELRAGGWRIGKVLDAAAARPIVRPTSMARPALQGSSTLVNVAIRRVNSEPYRP